MITFGSGWVKILTGGGGGSGWVGRQAGTQKCLSGTPHGRGKKEACTPPFRNWPRSVLSYNFFELGIRVFWLKLGISDQKMCGHTNPRLRDGMYIGINDDFNDDLEFRLPLVDAYLIPPANDIFLSCTQILASKNVAF